jgi:hypothetical protein
VPHSSLFEWPPISIPSSKQSVFLQENPNEKSALDSRALEGNLLGSGVMISSIRESKFSLKVEKYSLYTVLCNEFRSSQFLFDLADSVRNTSAIA